MSKMAKPVCNYINEIIINVSKLLKANKSVFIKVWLGRIS